MVGRNRCDAGALAVATGLLFVTSWAAVIIASALPTESDTLLPTLGGAAASGMCFTLVLTCARSRLRVALHISEPWPAVRQPLTHALTSTCGH
jgi:hypothetical protein